MHKKKELAKVLDVCDPAKLEKLEVVIERVYTREKASKDLI